MTDAPLSSPPSSPPASTSNAGAGGERPAPPQRHFIQQIIDADIASGKWGTPGDRSVVSTRFPPEPNGYLHVGHAKSVTLNNGLAKEFGGRFFLRFDDTNPTKEEQEYVDSIIRDVAWLGGDWHGEVRFASDYFEQMYTWARELIEDGNAYVDEQTPEQIRASRGDEKTPGSNSPYRDRPPAESLDLFDRMKAGEFPDGRMVLRARIDMASPNFNLRDPVMYRIVNARHHRTGEAWSIYPMYDWAHGLEDSIEGITHSICTLEFEVHRPLYDWFIRAINMGRGPGSSRGPKIHHPQQIEFARLNPTYIVTSKRKLKELVDEGKVDGWDDPRMATVSGLRRRGYLAQSLRRYCDAIGTTKFNASQDIGKLEHALREDLNAITPRRMAVLRPLKVTITNWGEHGDAERIEHLEAGNNPEDANAGTRAVAFGRELFIEQEDFMMDPPKGFFRLRPGGEVRLRSAYWITCNEVVTNDVGDVVELLCTYDPHTRGGNNPPPDTDGKVRKVKGTLHWVCATECLSVEVRLFDRLYRAERPGKATGDHRDDLNPDSLEVIADARVEKALGAPTPDEPAWPDGIRRFQFERVGYFCIDQRDGDAPASDTRLVFNRTVSLKDGWAKDAGKG